MTVANPNIAPRCTVRPRETIYNPEAKSDHPQNRGNPYLLGWMFWVMSLSFETLLHGVPGTGTRDKGMKGRMLQVNMDGIVLLRLHQLGFKVSMLTTFLALFVLLPLNLSAGLEDNFFSDRTEVKFETTTLNNIFTPGSVFF